jgi:hypothetical protein
MLRLGSCCVLSLCSLVAGCANIWFTSAVLCAITYVQKFKVFKHKLQGLANMERYERMIIYRDLEWIGEEIIMAHFKLHCLGTYVETSKCSVRLVFVSCDKCLPNVSLHQTCCVQC